MQKMTTKQCKHCSRSFDVRVSDVNRGRGKFCSRNCVSLWNRTTNNSAYRHGANVGSKQTPEYVVYNLMKARCLNKNNSKYKYYGSRGIKICDRWLGENGFINFLNDMGVKPSNKHSIDRIDVNGNYEPSNCRWATRVQQANNMRTNVILEFNSEKKTQEEWGKIYGISGSNIHKRLKRGWSIEDALTKPMKATRTILYMGEDLTILEWSKKLDLDYATIRYRLKENYPLDMVFTSKKHIRK